MSDAVIRSALENVVLTWANAEGLAVAFENTIFAPPDGHYVRVHLLPATTNRLFLDDAGLSYKGVFQVTFYMVLDTAVFTVDTLIASLRTALGSRITLEGVVIYLSALSKHTGYPADGRFVVPVSCGYRSEVA